MFKFDINTDAAVIFTNKLEKLHRSALPVAVRSTLNSAAFNVKTDTMPKEAGKFINRRKTFFKATSRVEKANGFKMDTMKSMVGFIGASGNQAVDDLNQQEHGGDIDGRSFVPMDTARVSNNNAKSIRSRNRIKNIQGLVDARKGKGRSNATKFIRAVHKAGSGGYVLADHDSKGKTFLFRVNSIGKSGTASFRLTLLYSFEKDRAVRVKRSQFMRTASLLSASRMPVYYEKEAIKQINRLKL